MDVSSARMMPMYTALNRLEPPASNRVDLGSRVVDSSPVEGAVPLTKSQTSQQAGVAPRAKANAVSQHVIDKLV